MSSNSHTLYGDNVGRRLNGLHDKNVFANLEEILDGVSAIVVCNGERRRLEFGDARRDVACQCELVDVIMVEDSCHARRYDHHDGIASCAQHISHAHLTCS